MVKAMMRLEWRGTIFVVELQGKAKNSLGVENSEGNGFFREIKKGLNLHLSP